jgi:D-lyxose ketol-isomerase
MKRSEINSAIRRMEALAKKHGFLLPPFCFWAPEEWRTKGREYDELRDNMLGWDVTDYGTGAFSKTGFTLITLRNGNANRPDLYKKTYAEKLLMLEPGQYAPMHFHRAKMEDIINRGGGTVLIRLYYAAPDETLADTNVQVLKDGRSFTAPAGTQIRLEPGESITLCPYLYHDFELPPDGSAVLLGEVSMTNDDTNDNRFFEPLGRFPVIEEDEPPYRLLCTEYPKAEE